MEFTSIILVIFLAQSTYGVPTDTTLAPDTTTLQQPEKVIIYRHMVIKLSFPDLFYCLSGPNPDQHRNSDHNPMLEQFLH